MPGSEDNSPYISDELAEELGREVRLTWITWAAAEEDPKPGWLLPWQDLEERYQDVDRLIGRALYARGWRDGQRAKRPPPDLSDSEARAAVAAHDASCATCRGVEWQTDRCEEGLELLQALDRAIRVRQAG